MKVFGKHLNFNKVIFNPLRLLLIVLRYFQAACFLVFNLEKLFTRQPPLNAFTCYFETS